MPFRSVARFRCFAYPTKGAWYAECIDLGLVVKAESFEAAKTSLHECIQDYLEVAHGEGWYDKMVPRRAPLSRFMHYYWIVARYRIDTLTGGLRRGKGIEQHGYAFTCSAT